jgi:hypothetical protein
MFVKLSLPHGLAVSDEVVDDSEHDGFAKRRRELVEVGHGEEFASHVAKPLVFT